MDYVIGVDAGGTKTEAIAYDLKGHELIKKSYWIWQLSIE